MPCYQAYCRRKFFFYVGNCVLLVYNCTTLLLYNKDKSATFLRTFHVVTMLFTSTFTFTVIFGRIGQL
jgi:hypothetical protein